MEDIADLSDFELEPEFSQAVDEKDYRERKDALLYAIEVSPETLSGNGEKSILYRALEAAVESVRARIFESSSNKTGILLYGTENTTSQRYPYVYNLLELSHPTAKDVKHLMSLLREETLFKEELKASQESPSLANVLYSADIQFSSHAAHFVSRRLMLVTRNDDPHPGDENQMNFARTAAQDLVDKNIRIVPTFITTQSHKFDLEIFWESIRYEPRVEYEQELKSSTVDELNIKRGILSKHIMRRTAYSVTIELGPLKFAARGFLIESKQKVTKSHKLYMKEERPSVAVRKAYFQLRSSAKDLEEDSVKRGYKVAGTYVILTKDEVDLIKRFEKSPVLRILGFKPLSAIELWQNITHPFFFYPYDDRIRNSRKAFTCLYKVLLDKQKVAIAWCVIQNNASPRLAALIPSPEETKQPGLQLVFLPFAEEIRDVPVAQQETKEGEENLPSDEAIDLASMANKAIKLADGYVASRYPNTRLQSYYNHLEALALGEEEVQEPTEIEIPNDELDSKAGDLNERLAKKIKSESLDYD